MAQLAGPNGRLIGFEPQRVLYQIASANVAINGLWNVQLRNAAAGNASGTAHVCRSPGVAASPQWTARRRPAPALIPTYPLPALPRVSDDVKQLSLSLSQRPTRAPPDCRVRRKLAAELRLGSGRPRRGHAARRGDRGGGWGHPRHTLAPPCASLDPPASATSRYCKATDARLRESRMRCPAQPLARGLPRPRRKHRTRRPCPGPPPCTAHAAAVSRYRSRRSIASLSTGATLSRRAAPARAPCSPRAHPAHAPCRDPRVLARLSPRPRPPAPAPLSAHLPPSPAAPPRAAPHAPRPWRPTSQGRASVDRRRGLGAGGAGWRGRGEPRSRGAAQSRAAWPSRTHSGRKRDLLSHDGHGLTRAPPPLGVK
jgi:hypothetical protein